MVLSELTAIEQILFQVKAKSILVKSTHVTLNSFFK